MPTEADTCRKHVVPLLQGVGWDTEPTPLPSSALLRDLPGARGGGAHEQRSRAGDQEGRALAEGEPGRRERTRRPVRGADTDPGRDCAKTRH